MMALWVSNHCQRRVFLCNHHHRWVRSALGSQIVPSSSPLMTTYSPLASKVHWRDLSSLSKSASTAPVDFDVKKRFWNVLPANAVHLSIGSVYVYSMWTPGMTQVYGVVSSAPLDWTHSEVLPVFSAAAATLGFTTAFLGSWVERVGPRMAGFVGSAFWSSAMITTAYGVNVHSLPLVYLGWGVLGGVGWGLMYLAPVTTVMKWFPDRRGLATGIALSAFGAGAAVAPSIIQSCLDFYAVAPDFIGPLASSCSSAMPNMDSSVVTLNTLADGTQVVADNSALGTPGQPVVVATASDLAKTSFMESCGPGVYALGTGETGTANALATLGVFYGSLGMLGSRFMRCPHPDWTPQTSDANSKDTDKSPSPLTPVQPPNHNIGLPASYVTSGTTQFPLLCLTVFGYATGGLALLSSSKLMLTDIWAGAAPSLVTENFSTAYVTSLGFGMAFGRFGWSALSDHLGRKNTYALFGLSAPMVGLAPLLCHSAATTGTEVGALPVFTFCGGSILAITCYGGIFSVLPAYIADLFGQKHAGAIHGKALTAWAASAICGPMGLAFLRSQSVQHATHDLLGKVENTDVLERAFGCSLQATEQIQTLIDSKTITIARLMELVPPGTIDPTPFLYDTTCYVAAALMGIGALANYAIQPLDLDKALRDAELAETNNSDAPVSVS